MDDVKNASSLILANFDAKPCQEKEWQEDIKNLTGQEVFRAFTEKYQANLLESNLQWVPYEEFTGVEYLATGGFSKIYKAEREKQKENGNNAVVLKLLSNSQKIVLEFLIEIANTGLFGDPSQGSVSNIMTLYGISQDPKTKNYATVMPYKKDGNLRQMLQKKANELSLRHKFKKLKDIAEGLYCIHEQNLIHRDLHSGNVLNDYLETYITDLGLSQPASYQKEEDKILAFFPM